MAECEWPVSYAACAGDPWADEDAAEEQDRFEQMAADLLRQWTGGRYGVCTVTVRPCREACPPPPRQSTYYGRGPYPATGGVWTALMPGIVGSVRCGSCRRVCSCRAPRSIRLPGPIVDVTEVLIDGDPLPEGAYRVDGGRYLVRTDGGSWPTWQDLEADPDEDGTWQVTYRRGVKVPDGGQIAAGVLAMELWKAACGDEDCGLPQRLQTVTRQGVTVGVAIDQFEDVEQGRTGIWLVDSWVASVTKPRPVPILYSPDIPARSW